MPLASHRISVFVVPKDPEQVLSGAQEEALLAELERRHWLSERGQAGEQSEDVIEGGFQRLRVDRPGRPVLYGNRLGGFRARCPSCGASVAAELGAVLEVWREQGHRESACRACGSRFLLEEWEYAPHASPGRWALVFSRAGSPSLKSTAREALEEWLGFPVVEVVSRG